MSRVFPRLVLALLWPTVAQAQAPAPTGSAGGAQVDRPEAVESVAEARIVQVALEPVQPAFGEVFQVRVTLRLGPTTIALLPDTLIPTATAESAGAGEWQSAAAPGDSLDVSATYPVIGFIEGLVELPWMELAFMRAGEAGGGSASVMSLADVQAEASARPPTRFLRLGGIDLGRFEALEAEGLGASPRPPADVLGSGWSVWRLLAVTVFALAGVGLVLVLVREARDRAEASEAGLPRGSPREEALRDLERILALGWHRNGRVDEFYAGTGDALRRFAGTMEPVWGLHLTSSELLAQLGKHRGLSDNRGVHDAIRAGERVKFGRERPDPERAEAHWTAVRDWIRTHPET